MAIVGHAPLIFHARVVSRLSGILRARVYFSRPTITIAKIRDYSQSTKILFFKTDYTIVVANHVKKSTRVYRVY